MNIYLVTPAPPRSRKGNRVTALRWARILRNLGHRVRIAQEYAGQPCELMVALHARRSFSSIQRFHRTHPARPLIVALTGTDLYGDLQTDASAQRALEMATRLIVLQSAALEALPKSVRDKVRVIHQSVKPPAQKPRRRRDVFEVCVLGHLREVKDPFRTAEAVRLLPASSRVTVLHAGAALEEPMADRARREAASNPRYQWLGELPRWKAMHLLARSRLLVLTSIMEGGANVVSEAIAASTPVLSSRIPGSVGLLGEDYPGYFPVGDTAALAALLQRTESDAGFHESLDRSCRSLAWMVDPAKERGSWVSLLRELFPESKQ